MAASAAVDFWSPRTLTDGIVQPGRQADIAERILALETLKDTSELTRLLAPSVGAAFH